MTPAEALEAAALAGDQTALRDLIAPMTETERSHLGEAARRIVAAGMAKADLRPMTLVAYGFLPVSEIRRLGWRARHLPTDLDVVIRHRDPERLLPIVDFLLDEVTEGAWATVRPLVRDGTIPRPDRPSYTIALLEGTRHADLPAVVADDPGILDVEAWRLFEVEGGGEASLANHEKYTGDRWGDLFRDLAAHEPVMRARLLDASLAALARDFGSFRAGWFSRFHASLAPTDVERAERVDAYLGLLRSRVGPTVSFAVAALARIERVGALPPDSLIDRIDPVLADGPAGTAKAALRLVGDAGRRSADGGRRAALVAVRALGHPSADVQGAAISLIEQLEPEPDDEIARAVVPYLGSVAASQRDRVASLVGRRGGSDAIDARPAPDDGSLLRLDRRVSATDPARAIDPVVSTEALVDIAVSVLESGEPADDVERLLDGVGRSVGEGSLIRSSPAIARRARTILGRRDSDPFSGFDVQADVAAVLLAWTTGEVVEPGLPRPRIDPGAGAFLSARAREVASAAADRRRYAMVAMPTHTGGWIEPSVLVRRLADDLPASTLDLVAAILRLAPDGREVALRAASRLPGEAGAALRYALGGAEEIGPTAAWWVAAARVRSPGLDDPAVEARHPRLGPDAALAARVALVQADPRSIGAGLALAIDPPMPGRTSVDLPTVLMLRDPSSFSWTGRSVPATFRWMATIQPGDREAWSAIGSLLIARNVDWWSAEWANRAFLEPFLDPAASIGPHARRVLGVALGSKEAGERGLATDVVTIALADGRITAAELAEGLAATIGVQSDRPARWATSLSDVAASSGDHARAVATAIATSLPALADRPVARLVPLLRLLDELLVDRTIDLTDGARSMLRHLASSGGVAGRLAASALERTR